MLGVIGGILSPVKSASSGTIRSPDAQLLGTPDDPGFFPSATTPPVNVTFVDAVTTFAGSERPEMMTAWMVVAIGPIGTDGGPPTGTPIGGLHGARLVVML
jgi:hypothetical protein